MANVTQLREYAMWTKAGPIAVHDTETNYVNNIAAFEEQAAASVGDPAPFGLWAFATGTWIAGTVFGGAFPYGSLPGVAPLLLLFAGIGQFIAGLFAYRRTNSLMATAFCSFGSLYVTIGTMLLMTDVAHVVPAGVHEPVFMGLLLESFAFIAFALALASARTNVAIMAFLGLLTIGYMLVGIPQLAASVGTGGWGVVGNVGGWFMVASSFFAAYAGLALVVNSTWRRMVLPLGGEP